MGVVGVIHIERPTAPTPFTSGVLLLQNLQEIYNYEFKKIRIPGTRWIADD